MNPVRCRFRMRVDRTWGQTREGRGFSVVELMVASGLLAAIMVGLLAMFYQTERAFRTGVTQADILEGGRITMELFRRDFSTMTPLLDTNAEHFVMVQAIEGIPQSLSTDPVEWRTNNFLQPFWLLRRMNNEWHGVRYDFDWYDDTVNIGRLYRMETNMVGYGELEMADIMRTNDYFNQYIDPLSGQDVILSNRYGSVIDGVVNLTVKAYDGRGNIITNFPVAPNFGPPYYYAFYGTNAPASVEVELGVLETRTLEKARALMISGLAEPSVVLSNVLNETAGGTYLFRERVRIRSTQ